MRTDTHSLGASTQRTHRVKHTGLTQHAAALHLPSAPTVLNVKTAPWLEGGGGGACGDDEEDVAVMAAGGGVCESRVTQPNSEYSYK